MSDAKTFHAKNRIFPRTLKRLAPNRHLPGPARLDCATVGKIRHARSPRRPSHPGFARRTESLDGTRDFRTGSHRHRVVRSERRTPPGFVVREEAQAG